jgi:GTP cyclohydrolase II
LELLSEENFNSYELLLKKLTLRQDSMIKEFYGGPLHLGSQANDWITPLEYTANDGVSHFHIIYSNTHPTSKNNEVPVTLLFLDEIEFKILGSDNPKLRTLNTLLNSYEPNIFIRPCRTGMLYYPHITLPHFLDIDLIQDQIKNIAQNMGWDNISPNILNWGGDQVDFIERNRDSDVCLSSLRCINNVYITDFMLNDDPWQHYQFISRTEIHNLPKKDFIPMRLDSGCDTGQIYLDKGCDCRQQLHNAIDNTLEEDGFVVHLPTQDGRGYGMATKLETEGLKTGKRVVTNATDQTPKDTIEAAMSILGDNFDIRTYDGVGRILNNLGFNSVTMYTNNRRKMLGLTDQGIKVQQKSAQIMNPGDAQVHIESKMRYKEIYFTEP